MRRDRMPTLRTVLAIAAAAMLAAACGGDAADESRGAADRGGLPAADGGAPEGGGAAGDEAQPEPEVSRRIREEIRARTRAELPEENWPDARAPAPGEPAIRGYEDCMERARRAGAEEREILEETCARLPRVQ